jgi:hypothetical protein
MSTQCRVRQINHINPFLYYDKTTDDYKEIQLWCGRMVQIYFPDID